MPYSFTLIALIVGLWNVQLFHNDPPSKLTQISNEYKSYSRMISSDSIQDRMKDMQWTTALCVSFKRESPSYRVIEDSVHFSLADASVSPHGNRLYQLYVKDKRSYDRKVLYQPLGQTLVKETWNVVVVPTDSIAFYPLVKRSRNDNLWYRPTTIAELFIMTKEEPSSSNDQGWTYAIVDVSNNKSPEIIENGKISSCIQCHKDTKYDRLFGP